LNKGERTMGTTARQGSVGLPSPAVIPGFRESSRGSGRKRSSPSEEQNSLKKKKTAGGKRVKIQGKKIEKCNDPRKD